MLSRGRDRERGVKGNIIPALKGESCINNEKKKGGEKKKQKIN